jgi:hypothetical protein
MTIAVSRDVRCPQDLAFPYYSDRDLDLEWFRGARATHRASEVQRGVGEIDRQKIKLPGTPFVYEMDLEVVEWSRPNRYREVVRNGLTQYDVCHAVNKIDEEHSRVGLYGDCYPKGWLKVFHPIASRALNRITRESFDRLQPKLNELGSTSRERLTPDYACSGPGVPVPANKHSGHVGSDGHYVPAKP